MLTNISHFSVPHSESNRNMTGHLSANTAAITVGITEEEQDSVHSLSPKNKGYYEWKQEHCSKSGGGSLTAPIAPIIEE